MDTLILYVVVATNSTRVLHLNSSDSRKARTATYSYYFIVGSSSDSRKARTATPTTPIL